MHGFYPLIDKTTRINPETSTLIDNNYIYQCSSLLYSECIYLNHRHIGSPASLLPNYWTI